LHGVKQVIDGSNKVEVERRVIAFKTIYFYGIYIGKALVYDAFAPMFEKVEIGIMPV
jgi:hypothetical protein